MDKKIAVIGRDHDAWLTALFLQLGLGRAEAGYSVTLVELPSELKEQDVVICESSMRAFWGILGVGDKTLLGECGGLPSLGQRFTGWKKNSEFIHAYDSAGVSINGVDFFQYYVKAVKSGLKAKLEDFSLGAIAAKKAKMLSLSDEASAFSCASYGYNLPALEYVKFIAKATIQSGVTHIPAEIESVERSDDRITSVLLTSGIEVKADLYIDASGFNGEIINELTDDKAINWRKYFPFSRQVVANTKKLSPLPSFSQHTAFSSGFISIYPLHQKSVVSVSIDPLKTDPRKVPELVETSAGLSIDNLLVRDRDVGARKTSWVGNCVAVGEAIASLDLIDSVQPYILSTSLSYLLTLLPNSDNCVEEAEIYSEKMFAHVKNLRDFQWVRYLLSDWEEESWKNIRKLDVPQSLKEKMRLFLARGEVLPRENELHDSDSWKSVLVGMGCMPEEYNPLVDTIGEQELISKFQQMMNFLSAESDSMPDMQTHIRMSSPAPSFGAMF